MYKDLPNYPLYKISDTGEVISMVSGKPLKTSLRANVLYVQLINTQGIRENKSVLALVKEAFLKPSVYEGKYVHYVDNNPYNLAVKNLYFNEVNSDADFSAPRLAVSIRDLQTSINGAITVFNVSLTKELLFNRVSDFALALRAKTVGLHRIMEINSHAQKIEDLLPTVDFFDEQWVVMKTVDYKRLAANLVEDTAQQEYDDAPDNDLEIV